MGRAANGPRNGVRARTPTPALGERFSRVAAHGTPSGGLEPPGAPDQHHGSPGPGPGLAGVPAAGEAESSCLGPPPAISPVHRKQMGDTPGWEEGHEGRGLPDLRRRVRPAWPTAAGCSRPAQAGSYLGPCGRGHSAGPRWPPCGWFPSPGARPRGWW